MYVYITALTALLSYWFTIIIILSSIVISEIIIGPFLAKQRYSFTQQFYYFLLTYSSLIFSQIFSLLYCMCAYLSFFLWFTSYLETSLKFLDLCCYMISCSYYILTHRLVTIATSQNKEIIIYFISTIDVNKFYTKLTVCISVKP